MSATVDRNALELVELQLREPKTIIQIDDGKWKISKYKIAYDYDGGWYCECGWFSHKGECKHIKAIKECKKKGILIPLITGGTDHDSS